MLTDFSPDKVDTFCLLIYNLTPFTRYKKTDYCTNIHYFRNLSRGLGSFIEKKEIPESWEWVKLGDVAYIASGMTQNTTKILS